MSRHVPHCHGHLGCVHHTWLPGGRGRRAGDIHSVATFGIDRFQWVHHRGGVAAHGRWASVCGLIERGSQCRRMDRLHQHRHIARDAGAIVHHRHRVVGNVAKEQHGERPHMVPGRIEVVANGGQRHLAVEGVTTHWHHRKRPAPGRTFDMAHTGSNSCDAALLRVDTALSGLQLQILSTYLQTRWGVQLPLTAPMDTLQASTMAGPVPTTQWLATEGITQSNGTDAGVGDAVQTWSACTGSTGSTTQWTASGVLANVTVEQSANGKHGVRFMGNVVLAIPDTVMKCTTPVTILMAYQWTQPLTTWVNILGKGQAYTLHFYIDPTNQYLWLRPNYTKIKLFIVTNLHCKVQIAMFKTANVNKQLDTDVWHCGGSHCQPCVR